jgi:GTP-binding protein
MKVRSAHFLKSALLPAQFPDDGRPEIAFIGRSNVGKSTLLNVLLNRKGLAKVSKTPGKTRTINFFDVNGELYFVDLPGYGFAKVSKALRRNWEEALTGYLRNRPQLKLVLALFDARHEPGEADRNLLALLGEARVATLLVATKVDKVATRERARTLDRLRRALDSGDDALIVAFSATTKVGLREVWRIVDEQLRSHSPSSRK